MALGKKRLGSEWFAEPAKKKFSLTKTNTLISMKRDWELLKEIIETAEKCDGGYPLVATNGVHYNGSHIQLEVFGRAFGEVFEHILLLGDAGLAEVRDLGRSYDGPSGVAIDRLTMAGHDFLAGARDDQRWNQAMTMIKDKGGAVSVGVLTQILATLLKQSFGIN